MKQIKKIHQSQRTYLDSHSHCLVFISAFQRIRESKNDCNKKTSSEKKKSEWSNSQPKKKIITELCDSLSSICKMSLREIHSK